MRRLLWNCTIWKAVSGPPKILLLSCTLMLKILKNLAETVKSLFTDSQSLQSLQNSTPVSLNKKAQCRKELVKRQIRSVFLCCRRKRTILWEEGIKISKKLRKFPHSMSNRISAFTINIFQQDTYWRKKAHTARREIFFRVEGCLLDCISALTTEDFFILRVVYWIAFLH